MVYRLYWTKTYYPIMDHIKQVGGKKKVKGTTIANEATRITIKSLGVLLVVVLLRRNPGTVLGLFQKAAANLRAVAGDLHLHAKSLIASSI